MFDEVSDSTHKKSTHLDDQMQKNQLEINKILNDGAYDENISNASQQLEAIKNSLQEIPEINEARILYFKAEIELDNYQISAAKIAEKMLNIDNYK